MDFVLALHGHLPWVLHHGRWPHGSVWLSEGALDSYLPLIEALQALEREGIPAPITLGITPILANQLSHPSFISEFEAYMERRLDHATRAPENLRGTGDAALASTAEFWRDRLTRLYDLFRSLGGDLIGALRGFEARGVIEIISSAATHGFLPLLGRDESVKLQLAVGVAEHERLFGRTPTGCWVPECAYRPAGPWNPGRGATPQAYRPGTDEFLVNAGYRYFFIDSHLVHAGAALGYPYPIVADLEEPAKGARTPYTAYRVASKSGKAQDLFALVRDPRSSGQVWSRAQGYPGDGWYLEFHKTRWPDGLRLWRVTGAQTGLGDKRQYDPVAALARARNHASHFAGVLHDTASKRRRGVVAAPFDAELFGHWWFEGVDFLSGVYRALTHDGIRPVTARQHIASAGRRAPAIQLTEGSWGKDGNFSMWLNDQTAWTWQRLWALEDAYWAVARKGIAGDSVQRAVLAQATRSMLLAQASDWQFIISTAEAADYATQRFDEHCAQAEDLVRALGSGTIDNATMRRVEALGAQDSIFPNVLRSVEEVLS